MEVIEITSKLNHCESAKIACLIKSIYKLA